MLIVAISSCSVQGAAPGRRCNLRSIRFQLRSAAEVRGAALPKDCLEGVDCCGAREGRFPRGRDVWDRFIGPFVGGPRNRRWICSGFDCRVKLHTAQLCCNQACRVCTEDEWNVTPFALPPPPRARREALGGPRPSEPLYCESSRKGPNSQSCAVSL